jgi:hypothetical protein
VLGSFAAAVTAALVQALPGVFGGDPAAVGLVVVEEVLDLSAPGVGPVPGEPAREQAQDVFAVPPGVPEPVFTLTRARAEGPVVVRLRDADGSALAPLRPGELSWDDAEPDRLGLHLGERTDRDRVADLLVRYPVFAVSAQLRGTATAGLVLTAVDRAVLDRATSLAASVLALERRGICAGSTRTQQEGDFSTEVRVDDLQLSSVSSQDAGTCRLALRVDVTVTARRSLSTGEGRPIQRISSGGSAAPPTRPVVVEVGLDA